MARRSVSASRPPHSRGHAVRAAAVLDVVIVDQEPRGHTELAQLPTQISGLLRHQPAISQKRLLSLSRSQRRRLYPILIDTATLTGAILLIIGTATAMAWALTQSGFSRDLTAAMAHMPGGKVGFLAISIVAFIVLGAVLEGIPALVLFAPLVEVVQQLPAAHDVELAIGER